MSCSQRLLPTCGAHARGQENRRPASQGGGDTGQRSRQEGRAGRWPHSPAPLSPCSVWEEETEGAPCPAGEAVLQMTGARLRPSTGWRGTGSSGPSCHL